MNACEQNTKFICILPCVIYIVYGFILCMCFRQSVKMFVRVWHKGWNSTNCRRFSAELHTYHQHYTQVYSACNLCYVTVWGCTYPPLEAAALCMWSFTFWFTRILWSVNHYTAQRLCLTRGSFWWCPKSSLRRKKVHVYTCTFFKPLSVMCSNLFFNRSCGLISA